jgi:hypothetical protein
MSPSAVQCRKCKPTYERTPEHKEAMSSALAGKPKPHLRGRSRPEVAAKQSAAWTPEMREAARRRGLLAAESREWLLRIAESLSGDANPNFQGKGQESPYAPGWGRAYRAKIQARAAGICEWCGKKPRGTLDLHHKDFRKDNHDPRNLAVICRSCHKSAHATHDASGTSV